MIDRWQIVNDSSSVILNLGIGSYSIRAIKLSLDALGKLRAREKRRICTSTTIASQVLSQLPQCIHNSIDAQLKTWTNSFITFPNNYYERKQNHWFHWLKAEVSTSSHEAAITVPAREIPSTVIWALDNLHTIWPNEPMITTSNFVKCGQSKVKNEGVIHSVSKLKL